MNIAISGSHGFLGSHLHQALSSKKHIIHPITQELLYSPKDLKAFFSKVRPELIFHLAAYGNVSTQKDPAMTVMANIIGTFNMLNESKEIPYKCFINFGSSSEYGKKFQAMKETDMVLPETFYGGSKASATHLSYAFCKQYDKPIITVRPFSVYGPGEADFRFIPTIIRSMIKKETFWIDKNATHDWIYIDDFIDGLLLASENPHKIPQGIVNIGTGRMHTNKEVAEMLKKISGIQYFASPLEGMRKNDSEVWMSDNSLISSLGFYPKVMLQEGLEKTYQFYKEKYDQK